MLVQLGEDEECGARNEQYDGVETEDQKPPSAVIATELLSN